MRDFVDTAAGSPQHDHLARWADPVCLTFAGLTTDQARFFGEAATRIGKLVDVTVRTGAKCDQPVIVIFTDESERLLKRLPNARPWLLSAWTRHRRRTLAASAAPVRWLSRAALRGARGELPGGFYVPTLAGGTGRSSAAIQSPYPSRISAASRSDRQTMIILVDTTRLQGATIRALAEYLAMIILADPDARQPPPSPSILQLFDGAEASRSDTLTDWDRVYLTALYSSSPARSAVQQEREIASRMARELTLADVEP